jgi:hypothetical protein
MPRNNKRSSSTGVFHDSIRVRNSRSGTQYVRTIDLIRSDKVADKMKRASEVFRSSVSGRLVSATAIKNSSSSSKKK